MFKTPFNWFNKFGTLPETYKEAMSYEEQIMWLCKEVQRNESYAEEFQAEIDAINESIGKINLDLDDVYVHLNDLISNKQNKLTAGNGIMIQNDTISTAPTSISHLLNANAYIDFTNASVGNVLDLTPVVASNSNYLILDVNQGEKVELLGKLDVAIVDSNNQILSLEKDIEASSFDNPAVIEILEDSKLVASFYETNVHVPDARLFMSSDYIFDEFQRKQDKLTAGSGITIQNNVISSTGGDTFINISSLITSGSYIDLTNKSVGDTVNLTPVSATNTAYYMKEVIANEYFKIVGDVTVAEIDSENKIVNITSGTGTAGNPAFYTCIAHLPSNARIIISFQNTNTVTPALYDDVDKYYTFNNIETSKMIRKLRQDLYLEASDPNIPLINGLYYSSKYHVYVNGTINNDFNESIFYVDTNVIYLICSSGSFHKGNLHQEYWYNTSTNQWQFAYMNAITSWSEVNNRPSINNLSADLYLNDGTSSTGLADGIYFTDNHKVYINNVESNFFNHAVILSYNGDSLYVISSPYNARQPLGFYEVYYNSSSSTWNTGYQGMQTDWSLISNKPNIATSIDSSSTNDEIAGAKAVYDKTANTWRKIYFTNFKQLGFVIYSQL